MIAVDTNIVLRLLTRDEPAQAARTKARLESDPIFVPRTVVLESAWVMASIYRLSARRSPLP